MSPGGRSLNGMTHGLDRRARDHPHVKEWAEPVYHLYVIQTPDREKLANFLKERGVRTGSLSDSQPSTTSGSECSR